MGFAVDEVVTRQIFVRAPWLSFVNIILSMFLTLVTDRSVLRGAFKLQGLLKKRLLRPCNRGVSVVKNVYVYRVITLRNDCIFSFLW